MENPTEIHIKPKSDVPSRPYYHQVLSWQIKEEEWNDPGNLVLRLNNPIPGSYSGPGKWKKGGFVFIVKMEDGIEPGIAFVTSWHKDVDLQKLIVKVVYSLKSIDGEILVDFKSDGRTSYEKDLPLFNHFCVETKSRMNPENIYNLDRSFILQADILIQLKEQETVESKNLKDFVRDVSSILEDENNSDVIVRVELKEFKCHKNILSARSEVFKNMLAHDMLENKTNIIELKEITAEATEDMLKFIYTGTVAEDTKKNIDLLHAADMYQIEALREVCVKILLDSLNVSSCIPILVMVDRFIPHVVSVREEVVKFMKCKADELVDMEDWDRLMVDFPDLQKEVVKAVFKGSREKHMCKFCLISNFPRKI